MNHEFRKLAGIKEDTEALNRLKSGTVGYMELPQRCSGFVCGNCVSFKGEACQNPKVLAPVNPKSGCCNLFFPTDKETVAPAKWVASTPAVGEAAFDKGASDEAHTVAGEELSRALDDLQQQRADIDEEIAALNKAWSEWDYQYLLKKRYLSSSLVAKLKKEREYVYGK